MISYKALADEFQKLAFAGAALAKAVGPASRRVGDFLTKHDHALDVAGLGVLAAPAAADLVHARRHPGTSSKREIFHSGAELAGLGILAAPGVAHLLRK